MDAPRRIPVLVASFALALSAWGSAAEWTEAKSPHFTIYSDAGDKEARRVARSFERFRKAIGALWGAGFKLDLGRPVVIFAARNGRSLNELVPGKTDAIGSFFRSFDQLLILLRTDIEPYEGRQSLPPSEFLIHQHEYTHALMDLNYENVPFFLNEGLAEFWGNLTVRDDVAIVGGLIPGRMYWLDQRPLIPLKRLFEIERGAPELKDDAGEAFVYAESWAFVHFMLATGNKDRMRALDDFLQLLKAGVVQGEATRRAFGDLKVLDERFRRDRVYNQLALRGDFSVPEREITIRKMSNTEATALRGALLVRLGDTKEARTLLDASVNADPSSAVAHEGRAVLAASEKKWDEAVASAEKAIALAPERTLPHFLSGRAGWEVATTPEARQRVRDRLTQAVSLDSHFAPAYGWLALAEAAPGGKGVATALGLARRAVLLEPSAVEYRLTVARLLLDTGKADDSRREAERASQWARTPEDLRATREFLESLMGRD